MRHPITPKEQIMTSADRLARNIALFYPLSEYDVEDIVDAELATQEEFGPTVYPVADDEDEDLYDYRGSRWSAEFRNGRPHLVETIDVPPDLPRSVAAQEETKFGFIVDALETMWGRPLTDEQIAEFKADGQDVGSDGAHDHPDEEDDE